MCVLFSSGFYEGCEKQAVFAVMEFAVVAFVFGAVCDGLSRVHTGFVFAVDAERLLFACFESEHLSLSFFVRGV